jgi:hypothetical protein
MEVRMGRWKTKTPLSPNGSWTHGAMLHLKYRNNAQKNPTVSAQDVRKVTKAYIMAEQMVGDAIIHAQDAQGGRFAPCGLRTTEDIFDHYFRVRSPGFPGAGGYAVIITTLTEARAGLNDPSEKNRLYLFDSTSKANDTRVTKDTGGYVASYFPSSPNFGAKWDKKRPLVKSHAVTAPRAFQTTQALKGHIHLNIESGEVLDWATTIIHEATHRFSGTGDFAYVHETDKWKTLTWAEHLNNADSYAQACNELYIHLATWSSY